MLAEVDGHVIGIDPPPGVRGRRIERAGLLIVTSRGRLSVWNGTAATVTVKLDRRRPDLILIRPGHAFRFALPGHSFEVIEP